MRNPLKRRPSTEPKPSLRERLKATKAKAGRVLAVNRILLKPDPKPVPAVDRVALVNYATFLTYEHRRVQSELYPHMSPRKRAFTLGLCAAERFFFGPGSDRNHNLAPLSSSRAVKVLDFVGVNWREDLTDKGREHLDAARLQDDGERPPLPHGWPALDAGLIEALGDIVRLEATVNAMPDPPGREASELPEFQAMMDLRDAALVSLCKAPAESLNGLRAKAKALLDTGVRDTFEEIAQVAMSLARDLLGAHQEKITPQADPIFSMIDEAKRLFTAWDAAGKLPLPGGGIDPHPAFNAASDAFHSFVENVLLHTVPRTGEGCAALARYCGEIHAAEGFAIDEVDGDAHLRVLDLIARSPLL